MYKLCFWTNMPTHHQSAFIEAVNRDPELDMEVRYYLPAPSSERRERGWNTGLRFPFEKALPRPFVPSRDIDSLLPDWRERIHIISFSYDSKLSGLLRENHLPWCQWSEGAGIIIGKITGFRQWLYKLLMPFYLKIWKFYDGHVLNREALGIFCPGPFSQRYFHRIGVTDEKIRDLFYATAGVLAEKPNESILHFADGRKIFLNIGGLERRKGTDVLIRAFAEICSDEWCLVFCGDDRSHGGYEKLARSLGLESAVFFHPAVSSDHVGTIFSLADVMVFPSRYDGWGVVLQEAASMELPLIGTDMAGASFEVIENGQNGYIVKAGSVSSLAGAMKTYMQHSDLAKVHGRRSREIFENKLTPEINVKRLKEGLAHFISLSREPDSGRRPSES